LKPVDQLTAKVEEARFKRIAGPVLIAQPRPNELTGDLKDFAKPLARVGDAFELMLSFDRLKRVYHQKICEEWEKYWQEEQALFIADQRIKLLTEFNKPEDELSTERIKHWNESKEAREAKPSGEQRNPWIVLGNRLDVVEGKDAVCRTRTCVTSRVRNVRCWHGEVDDD
jgi:hypothetical protein